MENGLFNNSLNHLLLHNEAKRGDKIYLRQPRNGCWYSFTWAEVMKQARQVARFLQDAGLQRGDRVSIFSKNCAEWFITDFGISLAGMVNVPLFTNQSQEGIDFVLKHAGVKLVFAGKLDDYKRVSSYIPSGLPKVSFGYHEDLETDWTWADILAKKPLEQVTELLPDDLYTIIYSSGTTGLPKGAVYTHEIIARYLELYPVDIRRICDRDHYTMLSYLPLAHVYERSAIELGSITIPCDVSFVESLDRFIANLCEVKPVFFTAVPRIWGVFQQKIEQKISAAKLDFLLRIPFISGLIKKKIRAQLGLSNCHNCFSGAAHLPVSIFNFFKKLGIIIQEGYGQTENMAYATVTLLDNYQAGSVGTPRLQVEVKTGEQNELLIKSPCLMKEYYQDPEASRHAITEDGWLHTGDVAELDSDMRVKITGRLSENFKNQKGEFIAPAPIEKQFSNNMLIDQLCVVGRELPNNLLLVTLSEEGKRKEKELVKQDLLGSLHKVNSQLANYEKIRHIIVSKDSWTPENGLLTPTLKVKRRVVEESYNAIINNTIAQGSSIVWE